MSQKGKGPMEPQGVREGPGPGPRKPRTVRLEREGVGEAGEEGQSRRGPVGPVEQVGFDVFIDEGAGNVGRVAIDADTITGAGGGGGGGGGASEDYLKKMTRLLDSTVKVPVPSNTSSISPIMAPPPAEYKIQQVGREAKASELAASFAFRNAFLRRPELQPLNEPDLPFYAIGAAVRYLRGALGWEVRELAAYLMVSEPSVYRVEKAIPDSENFTSPAFEIPVMLRLEKLAQRNGFVKTALLLDSMTQAVIRRKQSKGRG